MYEKIVKKLIQAKKTGDKDNIINSIKFIHDQIINSINKTLDYKTFSMFVYDKDMVFKIEREELSRNSADIIIISNGLFAQVLEMADVMNYNDISDFLSASIARLHAKLSLNKKEISLELDELKQILKIIQNIYN